MAGPYNNADLNWHPAWNQLSAPPPDWYLSNGCTNAPDVIGTADLRPAAHRHDYRYEKGGTEQDRYVADMLFLHDAIQCCLATGARIWKAKCYYYRVRLWGYRHFYYADGHAPRNGLTMWWRMFFSRYMQW